MITLKAEKEDHPKKKPKKGKSLCEACHVHDLFTLSRYGDDGQQHTTSAQLHVNNACMPVNILFDTGALQGNYLSEDVAGWMQRQGAVAKADSSRVCGAFNECQLTKNLFTCNLVFSSLETLDSKHADYGLVDATRKRKADRMINQPSADDAVAKLDTSRAQRRKLSKLNALAAFEKLDRVTSETPEGTSRTESLDGVYEPSQQRGTSETPEGTSRTSIAPSNVQTAIVSVELDVRELEIPYDMIIGRPSICKHKLLQFDAQLCGWIGDTNQSLFPTSAYE